MTTTRLRCSQCLRAQSTCICALAQPVQSDVQVLILQHPMEVHEAKGTARLLHLCLGASSRIEVGEAFAPEQLHTLLHTPWKAGNATRQAVLLYPANDATDAASIQTAPQVPSSGIAPQQLRLVVIDGTWRKSRKMLYANPLLQALPRLALDDVAPGQYQIRKAHRADQLSTMEAVAQALAQLERWAPDAPQATALQHSFNALIQSQLALQAAGIAQQRCS